MFLTLVTVKQSNVHGACDDFRIGIHTEDGRNGQNTGSVEWTPWAVQDGGGWSAYAGDSNFYGPDGLKIGIECDTDSDTDYIEGIDFRLALQTCVGTSQSACASDPSDVQYTSWLTEMTDTGSYSGWAEVATRFMDGWRIQIETRDYTGTCSVYTYIFFSLSLSADKRETASFAYELRFEVHEYRGGSSN